MPGTIVTQMVLNCSKKGTRQIGLKLKEVGCSNDCVNVLSLGLAPLYS